MRIVPSSTSFVDVAKDGSRGVGGGGRGYAYSLILIEKAMLMGVVSLWGK